MRVEILKKLLKNHHLGERKARSLVPRQTPIWNLVQVLATVNHQQVESQECRKNREISRISVFVDAWLPGSPGIIAFGRLRLAGSAFLPMILVPRQTRTL